jgi:hypothetical protein
MQDMHARCKTMHASSLSEAVSCKLSMHDTVHLMDESLKKNAYYYIIVSEHLDYLQQRGTS